MNRSTTARAARIALLLLLSFVPAVLVLNACRTADVLTPDEAARVADIDAQAEESAAAAAQAEKSANDALQGLAAAGASGDPAQVQAAVEAYAVAREELLARTKELEAKQLEANAIADAAQQRALAPIAGAASTIPGWAPWATIATQLGATFLFDRSRKHALEALRRASKLQLGDFAQSLARALGFFHSSDVPEQILEGAAKKARDRGDTDLELAIRALAGDAVRAAVTPPPAPVEISVRAAPVGA